MSLKRLRATSDNQDQTPGVRTPRVAVKTVWAVLSAVATFGWVVALFWAAAWIAQRVFT